jgi:N-acylglucosamine-6-phosphate 2-epimerase
MNKKDVLERLKGGLIVSCQALPDEPMHGKGIMAKMAHSAELGGAYGIRANGSEDVTDIKSITQLPVIGIIKRVYAGSSVYITPTEREIYELVQCGTDIIATDATNRPRPEGVSLEKFFSRIRSLYPDKLFMADCSNYEEGLAAQSMGFDMVGTTLAGYTEYTKHRKLPDLELIRKLANSLKLPVIAEGGIWTPEDLKNVLSCGAYAAVIGTAITRPREITKRFCSVLNSRD